MAGGNDRVNSSSWISNGLACFVIACGEGAGVGASLVKARMEIYFFSSGVILEVL